MTGPHPGGFTPREDYMPEKDPTATSPLVSILAALTDLSGRLDRIEEQQNEIIEKLLDLNLEPEMYNVES